MCENVQLAIKGGASLVQYRNKYAGPQLRLKQSTALLALCRAHNIPFIINDHLDLCAEIDADGLHLGNTDCDLGAARRLLGPDKIIGASCYYQIELAIKAQTEGASYIAFGDCFAPEIQPSVVSNCLDLIAKAKQTVDLPIVGFGSITLDNASQVIAAGADMLAVNSDIFLDDDVEGISRAYTKLF